MEKPVCFSSVLSANHQGYFYSHSHTNARVRIELQSRFYLFIYYLFIHSGDINSDAECDWLYAFFSSPVFFLYISPGEILHIDIIKKSKPNNSIKKEKIKNWWNIVEIPERRLFPLFFNSIYHNPLDHGIKNFPINLIKIYSLNLKNIFE